MNSVFARGRTVGHPRARALRGEVVEVPGERGDVGRQPNHRYHAFVDVIHAAAPEIVPESAPGVDARLVKPAVGAWKAFLTRRRRFRGSRRRVCRAGALLPALMKMSPPAVRGRGVACLYDPGVHEVRQTSRRASEIGGGEAPRPPAAAGSSDVHVPRVGRCVKASRPLTGPGGVSQADAHWRCPPIG